MREILFRGKRLDNGEWIEGNFYESGISGVFILQNKTRKTIDAKTGEITLRDEPIPFEVRPSTIGQYVGLTDKTGKRIFEGDIVRCGTGRICKVTFFISPGVSGFDLVPIEGFDAPPPHNWSLFADTEVIGNIYDNPEIWGR